MKKLFVKTYGCQMNAYDSAKMADLLAPLGYAAADGPEGADMVILNTCHIREKAAEKVYSELGRLKTLKARKGARTAAACCWRWRAASPRPKARRLWRAQPAVDLVVGPQSYHRLPEMIARTARAGGHALETDFPALEKFDSLRRAQRQRRQRLPHRAGRLRQVLHLLRGALHPRRRTFPPAAGHSARGAAAGGQGRARDRAAGPERQRL